MTLVSHSPIASRIKITYHILDAKFKIVHSVPVKTLKFTPDTAERETELDTFALSSVQQYISGHNDLNLLIECVSNVGNRHNMREVLASKTARFIWQVENYCEMLSDSRSGSYIESSRIQFTGNSATPETQQSANILNAHKWSLHLYPQGTDPRFQGCVSLFLRHTRGTTVKASVEFATLNKDGKEIFKLVVPAQIFTENKRWGIGDYFKFDTFNSFKETHPVLHIACTIRIYHQSTTSKSFEEFKSLRNAPQEIECVEKKYVADVDSKIYAYLRSMKYCNGEVYNDANDFFQVHLEFLAAASDVLENEINAARAKADDEGDFSGLLRIKLNFKVECMRDFLRYLYRQPARFITNKPPFEPKELMQRRKDVYQFALEYNIKGLKELCEELLIGTISIENLEEMLKLADETKSEKIEYAVVKFVIGNNMNLIGKCEWNQLKRNRPEIIDMVMRKILSD